MQNLRQTRIFYKSGQTGQNVTQLTWMIWMTRPGCNAGTNSHTIHVRLYRMHICVQYIPYAYAIKYTYGTQQV